MATRRPLVIVGGASQELPSGDSLPLSALALPGYINGFRLIYNGTNSLILSPGSAYIPSLGGILSSGANIQLNGLALTASTLYHAYLYVSAGAAAVELVTTAPAAPYFGTARAKTGDTSRRYLGSILTVGANTIASFVHSATQGRIDYRISNLTGALLLLANGRATAATNVSLASVVPATATHGIVFLYNDPTTAQTAFYAASDGPTVPSGLEGFVAAGAQVSALLRLDANQAFSYAYNGSPSGTSGLTVRASGYAFER